MGALATLLGLGVLLVYLSLAGPTLYWLDSSELVAAAWGLGVAHPPGEPLPSLLGRLMCLLPVGTLAFRVTLASALQAAGATALTAVLAGQVLRRVDLGRAPGWLAPLAASLAALTVGLSYSLAFQAVRAEVYAQNLLLLLAGVCLLLRWDHSGDRRWLLAAALVAGLALCNHHFLVLLALVPVSLFVALRRPNPGWGRAVLGVLLAGALGLTVLAYLPLRAARQPQVNWGSPATAERFVWVVSARAFHKALDKAATESVEHRGAGAVFAVLGGLGPVAALLALGGIYLLLRRRKTWKVGLLLLLLAGFNLLSPLTVGFDPLNPDAHGYLAVAVAFLGPGLAVFLAVVGAALARRGPRLAALWCLAACGLPLYQGLTSLPRCDLRDHWAADETGRAVLQPQPRGALLVSSYFETVFNVWGLRAVADLRPDVTLLHRGFLGLPGYVEDLAASSPELVARARRWRSAGRLLLSDLDQLADARPLSLEYDLTLPAEVSARLRPAGLTLAYAAGAADAGRHRALIRRWQRALGPVNELETRRTVTWTHYLLAHHACAQGDQNLARYHHAQAARLAPRSVDLARLARRCGLP